MYQYNSVIFDFKITPAIFLQIKDAILADCKFAISYLDNILIKDERVNYAFER